MSEIIERELGWEDEIENDGADFILLPEGDYDFEVTGFSRARHGGSAKLPPCNKAELSILIETPEGQTTIKHNLFLHTKTEGLLCSFFTSIGQRKHGEKLKMNWNTVIGAKGRCKVFIDKYTNDKGEERQTNKIQKFYEPEEKQSSPSNVPEGYAAAPSNAANPFSSASAFVPGQF